MAEDHELLLSLICLINVITGSTKTKYDCYHTMVEGDASLKIWSSVTGYILLLLDVSNECVRVLISLENAPICLAVLSLS